MSELQARRAPRLKVEIRTKVEGIPGPELDLPEPLRAVYERVEPNRRCLGSQGEFVVRDISTNGAFLEGPPLPLMSRIRFVLPYAGGRFETVAWVIWRRTGPCEVETPEGKRVLPPGFGVLFEAFPLEVRNLIAHQTSP
jgi:hypothetical protein